MSFYAYHVIGIKPGFDYNTAEPCYMQWPYSQGNQVVIIKLVMLTMFTDNKMTELF